MIQQILTAERIRKATLDKLLRFLAEAEEAASGESESQKSKAPAESVRHATELTTTREDHP